MQPSVLLPVPESVEGFLDDVKDFSFVDLLDSHRSRHRLNLESWEPFLRRGLIAVGVIWDHPPTVNKPGTTVGFAVSPSKVCLSEHFLYPRQVDGTDFSAVLRDSLVDKVEFFVMPLAASSTKYVLPAKMSFPLMTVTLQDGSEVAVQASVSCVDLSSPTTPVSLLELCVSYHASVPFPPGPLFGLSVDDLLGRLPVIYEFPPHVLDLCDRYATKFRLLNRNILESGDRFDFREFLRREFHFIQSRSVPLHSLLAGYWFRFSEEAVSTLAPRCCYDAGQDTLAYFLNRHQTASCGKAVAEINLLLDEINGICSEWKTKWNAEEVFQSSGAVNLSFDGVLPSYPFHLDVPCRLVGDVDHKFDRRIPINDYFVGVNTSYALKFYALKHSLHFLRAKLPLTELTRLERMFATSDADELLESYSNYQALTLLDDSLSESGRISRLYYLDMNRLQYLQRRIEVSVGSLLTKIESYVAVNIDSHSAVGGTDPVLLSGMVISEEPEDTQPSSALPDVPNLFSTTHVIVGGTSGSPIFTTPLDSQFPVVVAVAQGEMCSVSRNKLNRLEIPRNFVQTFQGLVASTKSVREDWKRYFDEQEGRLEDLSSEEVAKFEFGRSFLAGATLVGTVALPTESEIEEKEEEGEGEGGRVQGEISS